MSRYSFLTSVENNTDCFIYDPEYDIILPNLSGVKATDSIILDSIVFSEYFDKLVNDLSGYSPNTSVCPMGSVFTSEYFVEVDYVTFMYNVPSGLFLSYKKCLKEGVRFIIIPVNVIYTKTSAHSNLVIIDNKDFNIELFEPAGAMGGSFYNISNHVINILNTILGETIVFYDIIDVNRKCKMISGLQTKQMLPDAKGGFCLAWSLLFLQTRLLNLNLPDSSSKILMYFNNFPQEDLDTYIKRYVKYLEVSTTKIKIASPIMRNKMRFDKIEIDNIYKLVEDSMRIYKDPTKPEQEKINALNIMFRYSSLPMFSELFMKLDNRSS